MAQSLKLKIYTFAVRRNSIKNNRTLKLGETLKEIFEEERYDLCLQKFHSEFVNSFGGKFSKNTTETVGVFPLQGSLKTFSDSDHTPKIRTVV